MGLDQEFISPRELADRHPLIDPDHYHAVLWDAQDGHLDPSGTTYAFAEPQNSMARSILRIVAQPECHSVPMEAGISRPQGDQRGAGGELWWSLGA